MPRTASSVAFGAPDNFPIPNRAQGTSTGSTYVPRTGNYQSTLDRERQSDLRRSHLNFTQESTNSWTTTSGNSLINRGRAVTSSVRVQQPSINLSWEPSDDRRSTSQINYCTYTPNQKLYADTTTFNPQKTSVLLGDRQVASDHYRTTSNQAYQPKVSTPTQSHHVASDQVTLGHGGGGVSEWSTTSHSVHSAVAASRGVAAQPATRARDSSVRWQDSSQPAYYTTTSASAAKSILMQTDLNRQSNRERDENEQRNRGNANALKENGQQCTYVSTSHATHVPFAAKSPVVAVNPTAALEGGTSLLFKQQFGPMQSTSHAAYTNRGPGDIVSWKAPSANTRNPAPYANDHPSEYVTTKMLEADRMAGHNAKQQQPSSAVGSSNIWQKTNQEKNQDQYKSTYGNAYLPRGLPVPKPIENPSHKLTRLFY